MALTHKKSCITIYNILFLYPSFKNVGDVLPVSLLPPNPIVVSALFRFHIRDSFKMRVIQLIKPKRFSNSILLEGFLLILPFLFQGKESRFFKVSSSMLSLFVKSHVFSQSRVSWRQLLLHFVSQIVCEHSNFIQVVLLSSFWDERPGFP